MRTPEEFGAGTIPGATCVPVDDLRARVAELPTGKELLVFCRVGLRGYVAARLLSQRGFRARNLSGGFIRYLMWKGTTASPKSREEDGRPSPDAEAVREPVPTLTR